MSLPAGPELCHHGTMTRRTFSRREVLTCAGGFAATALLASCGADAPELAAEPVADSPTPPDTPTPAPLRATSTPAPTATPTPPVDLDAAIGQMILIGFAGTAADGAPIAREVEAGLVGGVVLMPRNVTSPAQVRALSATLGQAAPEGHPLLISTDQEGGYVQRLGSGSGFAILPTAATIGRTNDPARALDAGRRAGAMLAAVGLNLNLAPVVDVNVNPNNPVIAAASRSFSPDPEVVAAMAAEVVRGHHEHQVLTTLKHFPGHGSSAHDSHLGFVDVTGTWSEAELVPYERLIAAGLADVIMVAHVHHGAFDPDLPASLSEAIVKGLLRDRLGYQGVVMTDSLQMGAIDMHWTFEDRIRLAVEAGIDVLAFTNAGLDPDFGARVHGVIHGLVGAGTVPASRIYESYERVMALKARLEPVAPG